MKKETIFRYEINESMAASAAMSCLKNRNNHKQLNETSDFDNRFALRKDLKGMANDVTKKAYMLIRKEFGDSMWRQLGMDDCDEQGLISQINDYQTHYGITDPQAIVNKMLGRKATEQEETVDIPQLAEDVVASYRGRLSNMDEKERVNFISTMVMKKMGKTIDILTPQEKKEILAAAKHSMWYVSEQEESTYNEKEAIAKQLMANYNPDTDEYDDPSMWLLYAIQERIGKLFLKMPKKEVKVWKKVIDSTINEYEFEKQHPAHYEHPEDEANLQSQLANAWDEGMEDDEDDYVPYENKFDETHRDIVDNLISAVEYYFDTDDDVNGFNHYDYTEDQLGKAVEKVLDKYGDFPSSNNFDKCYAWTKKHVEELMKILETGSLENPYEGHPEFDF